MIDEPVFAVYPHGKNSLTCIIRCRDRYYRRAGSDPAIIANFFSIQLHSFLLSSRFRAARMLNGMQFAYQEHEGSFRNYVVEGSVEQSVLGGARRHDTEYKTPY